MSRPARSSRASRSGSRRTIRRVVAVLLGLAGLVGGVVWLLRPSSDADLRALAHRAADGNHGVLFVSEVGEISERLRDILPNRAHFEGWPALLSSGLGSAPGLLVFGQAGVEARVDLAPGRAMAAKFFGHMRRDAWLRGGTPPADPSAAVWWERAGGRSASRWALARPVLARHLVELGDGAASSPLGGEVGDAWLAVPSVGSWQVWVEQGPEAGNTDAGEGLRRVRLRGTPAPVHGIDSREGRVPSVPWNDVGFASVDAGVSSLLEPSTWLIWAERNAAGAQVTLWRRSMARMEGASVELEIPRIARWSRSPTAAEGGLPAHDVVRRLGAEVRREELPDGGVLVGYDAGAIEALRDRSVALDALVAALPEDGAAWFVRPAELASWWRVARQFGRFGRAADPFWWDGASIQSALDRVDSVEAWLGPRSAEVEILVATGYR